jgi:hypothetical protein
MWDCLKCRTGNITPGVNICPGCSAPREEKEVRTIEAAPSPKPAKETKADGWGVDAKNK